MIRALALLMGLSVYTFALEPVGRPLSGVQRVYVEALGDTPQAMRLRDMVIASVQSSGVFKITEDAARADAVLRGSAEDQVYTEQHHSTDSISAGLHTGGSSIGSGRGGGSKSLGANLSEHESSQSSERRHEATVSVRLVNTDGDVIWSTTQESAGAKFKSASADVADKILYRLAEDVQKARVSAMARSSSAIQAGMPTR